MFQKITHILSLFLLISIGNISFAQTFDWAKNAASGTSGIPTVYSMIVDSSGNVYSVGGIYAGSVDFDPGLGVVSLIGNSVGQDIYIQKLDPLGNLLWVKLLSSSSSFTEGYSIKLDNNNNVYIVGDFDGMVDFDPGTAVNNISPLGFVDAFVLKLSSAGNFIWVKTFGGMNAGVLAKALAIDNNNDLVICGFYTDVVDFDPGTGVFNLTPLIGFESFLVKLSSAGNFIWAKALQSTNFSFANAIDIDAANNIYCGGIFTDNIDLNPGSATNTFIAPINSQHSYVVKLDPLGNYVFGKSYGGNEYTELTSLSVTNTNSIVIGGVFLGQNDFDPGAGSFLLNSGSGTQSAYILQLNNVGDFDWAKSFFGADDVQLSGLTIDVSGNVYSTGYFLDITDFDPGTGVLNFTPSGFVDIFISKLNSNGNLVFAHQIGGNGEEVGAALAIDSNNNIYGTGIFNGIVDFDPSTTVNTLTANPSSLEGDVYIFKWNQCIPTFSTINGTGCTYVLNGQTYTGNGTYAQVLTNSTGCDSIITLNLSGSTSNTNLTPAVCGGGYTYNGQTYTLTGVYTQTFTNAAGCDSNTVINLTVGNTTYSTTSASSCDFYVWNGVPYVFSGTFLDTIPNSTGCDSIMTLNLTINPSYNNSLNVITCGPYTFNGNTYSSSGNYTVFLFSTNGCDSLIDLSLTINPIPPTIINQSSCVPYTWYGQTYSLSGGHNHILTSSQGCDSILTLNLTINAPNNNVTQSLVTLTSAANAPTTYQWIKCNPYLVIAGATAKNYTAFANGQYAVVVTLNGCKDTSDCKSVIGIGIEENYLSRLTKIYPNPTDNLLSIEFDKAVENLSLKITSLTGQVLYENKYASSKKILLPTGSLAKGIYILNLNDGQLSSNLKFTKN
jgi:hypothetical protein